MYVQYQDQSKDCSWGAKKYFNFCSCQVTAGLNFDVEVRARARASARARARARAKLPHVKNSGGGMPPEFLTLSQVIPTSIPIPIPN